MVTNQRTQHAPRPIGGSFLYDPRVRGIVVQVLLAAAVVLVFLWIANNTIANLGRAHVKSGFGFF